MDLFAPLVHEFTYQAMAHDILPIRDGDKVLYKTITNEGGPNQEEKEVELSEKDRLWVENRHLHMKDLLEKLVEDFNKFRAENPQFADRCASTVQVGIFSKVLLTLDLSQQRECEQLEFDKRHACGATSVPARQGSLLVASRHGARMYECVSATQTS